jgi:hypothetical protein
VGATEKRERERERERRKTGEPVDEANEVSLTA